MKQLLITSAFLSMLSCVVAADELLLHYVSDDVPGGSYKYYSLMYDGIIKISLNSQGGDADLYVSQTANKPTYEPEYHCLQSTTCGEDIVVIPRSFKRPVSIGVYGHPSHETSRYSLLVYHVTLLQEELYFDEGNPLDGSDGSRNSKSVKKSLILASLWTLLDQLLGLFF